jgi:hypothetical protein
MGSLIQLGISAANAEAQYRVVTATQDAEKAIGSANIDVQNMLNETNANITNALRGENNALLAARAALGNFQKSAKAEAILKSAGSKFNAASTNLNRIADSQRGNSLERRIQAAETQGAMTAAAAATGTGGASQRMLKTAMAATSARREGRIEHAEDLKTYDMLAARAGIMPAAITALDQGQVFTPIDHTKTSAPKVISPMWQADFKPTKEQYVLNAVSGQLGNAAGSFWGKSSGKGTTVGKDGVNQSETDTSTSEWWSGQNDYDYKDGDSNGGANFGSSGSNSLADD